MFQNTSSGHNKYSTDQANTSRCGSDRTPEYLVSRPTAGRPGDRGRLDFSPPPAAADRYLSYFKSSFIFMNTTKRSQVFASPPRRPPPSFFLKPTPKKERALHACFLLAWWVLDSSGPQTYPNSPKLEHLLAFFANIFLHAAAK